MNNTGFFKKSGYHLIMAAIYILAGIMLLIKSLIGEKDMQLTILGAIIIMYGIYRFASGLKKKAVSDEK